MSNRVLPYGLIFSGVKGQDSQNLKTPGTIATSASNRAALKRRVFKSCSKEKCGSKENNDQGGGGGGG
tara:strand:+ start:4922 stop:5125 length:204 start_codon:yes stop_codon:yes gene_type:complete